MGRKSKQKSHMRQKCSSLIVFSRGCFAFSQDVVSMWVFICREITHKEEGHIICCCAQSLPVGAPYAYGCAGECEIECKHAAARESLTARLCLMTTLPARVITRTKKEA